MNSDITPIQISPSNFDQLRGKILKDRGFDLSIYTPAYIQRRVIACLVKKKCTFDEYIKLLDSSPKEYTEFFETLLVNVTEFFRDPPMWKSFNQDVIPKVLYAKDLKRGSAIRIWSAGCSSGEEPYSIAISMIEAMEKTYDKKSPANDRNKNSARPSASHHLTIYASDIDDDSLEKAKRGFYSKESVKLIEPSLLQKYFSEAKIPGPSSGNNEGYQVNSSVKKLISFRKHHLYDPPPFNDLDIVFCRNVSIYFNRDMKNRILENFYKALSLHSFLIIGKAESIFLREKYHFVPMNSKERIFIKEKLAA